MSDKLIARRGPRGKWRWTAPAAADDAASDEATHERPARRLSLPRLSMPSVRLPSISLPRLRIPHLRLPAVSRPRLKMPHPPRAPSLSLPRMPRPPRPRLSAVAIPTRWLVIGRFIDRITSREFWALTREDESGTGRHYTRFATLLGLFSLVTLATLLFVVIASLVSGDDSGGPAGPFDSPSPTEQPTEQPISVQPTTGQVEAPWIDAQMLQDDPLMAATILDDNLETTRVPQFGTAARHIRQAVADEKPLEMDWLCAIIDYYNTGFSTDESGTLVCTGELVTPQPAEDAISLAVWAGEMVGWWFGNLTESVATYGEGDELPFLLTWEAEPSDEYTVEITYDCSVGHVPAIDFLAGVESADADIFEARRGPGEATPDAAVPLPDTPDLDIDDGSVRLLYLYGGDFLLLPQGPNPADGCSGERTISFPVRANAEEMILMGSLRLAHSDDHRGLGAADVATDIGFSASVDGVGDASVELEHGAVVR